MRYKLLLVIFLLQLTTIYAQEPKEKVRPIVFSDVSLSADSTVVDTITVDTLLTDTLSADTLLPWPENLRYRVERLLEDKRFETSTVGLQIYDLTADSVLFQYNERQCMRPASTMKMINAVASLDCLGGSYQFKTRLRYTGAIDSCVLRGNLYCVGGMDPRFAKDDLRAFVENIKRMGIDTIRGNIVGDITMKDADLLGEGWCWDDKNPILTPLLYSGKNSFMSHFCQELQKSNIILVGDTVYGECPQQSKEICIRTHSIDQILMRMMKNSDNLYAECMFYQLAANTGEKKASAKIGRREINRLITKLGYRPSDYYIADGSGLSLYNYVSPELEVAFLKYAYHNQELFNHLLPSMPVAGVDGTLENRMKKGLAHGNVKAKTGTVTGVSALAGYCTAANGHQLCFSIINMGIRKAAVGRIFQDRVCEVMCQP